MTQTLASRISTGKDAFLSVRFKLVFHVVVYALDAMSLPLSPDINISMDERNDDDGGKQQKDKKMASRSGASSSSGSASAVMSGSGSGRHAGSSSSSTSNKSKSSTISNSKLLSDISNLLDKKLDNSMTNFRKELDDKISMAFNYVPGPDDEFDELGIITPSGSMPTDITPPLSEITDLDGFLTRIEQDEVNNLNLEQPSTSAKADVVDVSNKGSDELFDSVIQEFSLDENLGRNVNPGLANTINTLFRKRLSDDTLTGKLKCIQRPANCDSLIVPKVNPLIWDKMQPSTRSSDIKMQKLQNVLLKGTVGVVEVINSLLDQKDEQAHSLAKKLTGSMAFTGHVIYELNMKRRELIKPDLNGQFKQLCSPHVPMTDYLFSDDLSKFVKDISETQRVANRITKNRAFSRGTQNYRQNFAFGPYRGRAGFRGRPRYHPYQTWEYQQAQNFLWNRAVGRNKNAEKKTQEKNA
jgi:hypothetical protein